MSTSQGLVFMLKTPPIRLQEVEAAVGSNIMTNLAHEKQPRTADACPAEAFR
jgi:hypothetical protein